MPNYDLAPADASTPLVRLYEETLTRIPRGQQNEAEAPPMAVGVSPTAVPDGVAAASVTLRGVWLGTEASTLADRLRTILDDPTISEIELQAVDDSGTDVAAPYNGTYVLGGESRVDQQTPTDDRVWTYEIRLNEA